MVSEKKNLLYLIITFFIGYSSFAQLPDFTLNVTAVAQTCLGNGSLSFTVNGNNPQASMEFEIYLLPNTVTPVTTVTTPVASGLVAGNYMVVATQLLNGAFNTATGNATIVSNIVPLVYTINSSLCNNTGTITVNVSSGTALGYEIIAGPVVVAQQASNVFSGLPAGQYQVRVYDNCGDALVTTIQLQSAVTNLMVYNQVFPGGELPSCSTINVNHDYATLTSDASILWPLTFTFTVHPPGGGANIIITQQVNSSGQFGTLTSILPFYNNQSYSYDVAVTDACGNEFTGGTFTINQKFDFSIGPDSNSCNNFYIDFALSNFRLPCAVTFLSAPAGFNPALFNTSNPIINIAAFSYGSDDNPVPTGDYSVRITDACGRASIHQVYVGEGLPIAGGIVSPATCLGEISIKTAFSREIISVHITVAPAGYPVALPQDVSAYISGDEFGMTGMPVGQYELEVIDECGSVNTVYITINPSATNPTIIPMVAAGCDEGMGSMALYLPTGQFSSVIITSAPAAFNGQLPLNVSNNIDEDSLYLNSLPGGTYTFEAIDMCGNVMEATADVVGYHMVSNTTQVIYNCGSFDVDLHFLDNVGGSQSFWLQKFNEATGQWEHPVTGVPYNGGFVGDNNAIALTNNQSNPNNAYTGQFRILEFFSVFPNGNDYTNSFCIHEIYTFTYTGVPQILGAYAFPCTNGLAEVIIDAVGVAPLQYSITAKEGMPFVIDNAGSNVFLSLEEATYNFQVEDACNNLVNVIFDVSALSPLEIEAIGFCNGDNSTLSVPQYSFLTYQWYNANAPNVVLSTTNSLNFPAFNQQQDSGTYMVHIVSTTPGSCIDLVVQHTTVPDGLPNAGADATVALCRNGLIDLSAYLAGAGQTDGLWQELIVTGALNGSMLDTDLLDAGTYMFTYTVNFCSFTDEAVVTVQLIGDNSFNLELEAGCENEAFVISVTNQDAIGANAQYSWTGPGNFSFTGPEADITNLAAGNYFVTVINADGCSATATLPVATTNCMIPKGISPNGDGLNDSFDLSNLDVKHLKIFNRYGLEVYEKAMYIDEWKGQSDKGDLVTGTYFYVITLSTGKQVTGWVYLQKEIH